MVLLGVPRKKSPATPPGIDPGAVRLVAQCLDHYATPGPSIELYLTEIVRSVSQMFVVCLVGVRQRHFEPVVCVCTVRRTVHTHHWFKITQSNTDQAHNKHQRTTTNNFSQVQLYTPRWWIAYGPKHVDFSWFQTFAVIWILYIFFWVFPRRQIANYNLTPGKYPEENIQCWFLILCLLNFYTT